jgi:hypothetical protein
MERALGTADDVIDGEAAADDGDIGLPGAA